MSELPVLNVAIRHRVATFNLDIAFRLESPWTVLFAPSGAGKTTILRIIAGLDRAKEERIVWDRLPASTPPDQSVLSDTANHRFIPPHARRLPMVTQDAALFPHLTVAKNVSYGSRNIPSHSQSSSEQQNHLKTLYDLCRIDHLVDKFPREISGGERQRVTLARALAAHASAMLLDEPFTGIDSALKDPLMQHVKALLKSRQVPVLHITHDVGEVFAIADEVIRLEDGKVIRQGPPGIVLQEERARLSGWLTAKS